MQPTIPGIHHITAITGDPQRNIDFFMGLLGLRLIKKTVNFDDPGSYHFYYGDTVGSPTTVLTFFAWPGAARGRHGTGEVGATAFAIPATSLDFWRQRLQAHGLEDTEPAVRFGDRAIAFESPDGMPLELVATAETDARTGWPDGPVPAEHAVRGFHSATLWVPAHPATERVLTEAMGFRRIGEEGSRVRYATGDGGPGAVVDVVALQGAPIVRHGAGTVHHIAWRTPDDPQEQAWRALLEQRGLRVTEVRDRQYFHSIYYVEPGGVLYEIATDTPGFAIDERVDELGTQLKLPPWLEPQRPQIERALPPVHLPAPARD